LILALAGLGLAVLALAVLWQREKAKTAGLRQERDQLSGEVLKQRALRDTFSPLLPAGQAEGLLEQGIKLDGEARQAAVLACHLDGLDPAKPGLEPKPMASLLNRYYQVVAGCVERHGGSLQGIEGSLVLAAFNAPLSLEEPEGRAQACARDLEDSLRVMATQWSLQSKVSVKPRLGLAQGQVLAAHFGPQERRVWGIAGLPVEEALKKVLQEAPAS
jgi:adenylate cyclase